MASTGTADGVARATAPPNQGAWHNEISGSRNNKTKTINA